MLKELVSWDPATQDYPEVLTLAMLSELLLAPHNNPFSGLAYGGGAPVDPEEDPGSCRCLVLKEDQEATMAQAMEKVCKDEEENIPEGVDIITIEIDPPPHSIW